MAVSVTYPGVYVQEIPSAVHTIVGVPTSVAAFVGAAERGPLDEATQVDSWASLRPHVRWPQRQLPDELGGLPVLRNGGATAQVVRAGSGGGVAPPTWATASRSSRPPPAPGATTFASRSTTTRSQQAASTSR